MAWNDHYTVCTSVNKLRGDLQHERPEPNVVLLS